MRAFERLPLWLQNAVCMVVGTAAGLLVAEAIELATAAPADYPAVAQDDPPKAGPQISGAEVQLGRAKSFAAEYVRARDAKDALERYSRTADMIRAASQDELVELYRAVRAVLRELPPEEPGYLRDVVDAPNAPPRRAASDLSFQRFGELLHEPNLPFPWKRDLLVLWARNEYLWKRVLKR